MRHAVAVVDTLEVGQDADFERRWWTVQRTAWVILAIVTAAALAGAFGRGPLASASKSMNGVDVEWERIGRFNFGYDLEVAVSPSAAGNGDVEITLPQEYVRCSGLQRTAPRAVEEREGGDAVTYVFRRASTSEPVRVRFHLQPRSLGACGGSITVGENPAVAIRQFVLP